MEKTTKTTLIRFLLGETKYREESLMHLDEAITVDHRYYDEILKAQQWFRENGKKVGTSTPEWIEELFAKLLVQEENGPNIMGMDVFTHPVD